MNIHRTILIVFILMLFVTSACPKDRSTPVQDPVNIILFIADDLGAHDIGPYGNSVVRTPNLDRLADESLLFTNAFAGSPTCGPSRSTMLTGLFPFRHGAHGNHSVVREGTRSLVHYMKPLGYRVAIAGKLHVGPEEIFSFERISRTNVPEPGFEEKPGLHYDLNMDPVHRWLSEQKKDQPFFLIVADHSPHVIWPEDASYAPATVDIPAEHIDTHETRVARARYYTDITKMDSNVGKLLGSLDQYKLANNTVIVFISDQGPQWAFGKWSLYDDGIQVPLMIRWPGHVMPATKSDALVSLADLVPTFVEMAGGKVPASIDGESFLPLLNREKDAHREVIFASHTGDGNMNRSPARMLRTKQYKYILNLAPEILYTTHMDKAKDHDGGREYWNSWRVKSFVDEHAASVLWRYHNHPGEELYDLRKDPDELRNVIADTSYAEVVKNFRAQMKGQRQQQGDFETGPEQFQENEKKPGSVAPYIFLD